MQIKYKKATIGTTITWIAASFIIIIILLIFIGTTSFIAKMKPNYRQDYEVEIVTGQSSSRIQGDLVQTNQMIVFLGQYSDQISAWADDGVILTFQDITNGRANAPQLALNNFDELCEIMKKFTTLKGNEYMHICLQFGNKKIKSPPVGGDDCNVLSHTTCIGSFEMERIYPLRSLLNLL